MEKIKALIKLIRVYQWTKSGFVLMPFVFSSHLYSVVHDPLGPQSLDTIKNLLIAFLGFSFLASSIYVINDFKDRKIDREDPRKQDRPLASGTIGSGLAFLVAALLLTLALGLGFHLNEATGTTFLTYFLMNLIYSAGAKRIVLLDVFIISVGFVLRVLAGAFALSVDASPWLLSSAFFISLFLGFFKRYYEVRMSPAEAMIGGSYHAESLRSFINITASISIINYSIYTLQGTHAAANLFWTIPLVVLGIFRYYTLLQNPEAIRDGNPSDILLADVFLIVTILVWLVLCAYLILHSEPDLSPEQGLLHLRAAGLG
ncbi:MAG: UbiA prenyltransferase family protein [Leptospiraceae bacterium]|nr:UbiA prenyltransferase family protein [Leptospiraceae bacterium]